MQTRINAIVEEINYKTLADIGTDHGYIPILAVESNKVTKAIACDIKEMPLQSAKNNIHKRNLAAHIKTRLGPGLTPIKKDEVECITIAGMGGELICNILDESYELIQNTKQIILAPQSKVEEVRKYLHQIDFTITNESLVKDEGKYYHILNCKKGKEVTYTDMEYYIGKILLQKKDEIFLEYAELEIKKLETILKKVLTCDKKKSKELQKYINWYKSINTRPCFYTSHKL